MRGRSFLFCAYSLLFSFFGSVCAFGSDMYYLSGSDEDGCLDKQFCYCIQQDTKQTVHPQHYCLIITDQIACQPVSKRSDCLGSFFWDQGQCVSTALESRPRHLPLKSYDFCMKHHIKFCASDLRDCYF